MSYGFFDRFRSSSPNQDARQVIFKQESKFTVESGTSNATIFIHGFTEKQVRKAFVIFHTPNTKMDTVDIKQLYAQIKVKSYKLGRNEISGRVVVNNDEGINQVFLFSEEFITLNRKDFKILSDVIAKYEKD